MESVDGSMRIEGADRMGLQGLLRYCARPPFALEHLHQRDAEHLVYRNPKPVRCCRQQAVVAPGLTATTRTRQQVRLRP